MTCAFLPEENFQTSRNDNSVHIINRIKVIKGKGYHAESDVFISTLSTPLNWTTTHLRNYNYVANIMALLSVFILKNLSNQIKWFPVWRDGEEGDIKIFREKTSKFFFTFLPCKYELLKYLMGLKVHPHSPTCKKQKIG